MSNTYSARETVYAHLQGMGGGVPVVSAYKGASAVVPRYEVQPATEFNDTITLGADTMHTAEIAITAVVEANTGEEEFGPLVSAIQEHFAAGSSLDGIAIMGMPTPSQPITDGNEVRVPILVRYRAFLTT